MLKKILIITGLLSTISVSATETINNKWSGDAELGYLKTTGNTETESLHLKGKVINDRNKWRHTGTLEIVDKSDTNTTTAKRWYITGQSDYKIDDKSYLFLLLSHEDDEFSGYKYQTTEVIGYGYTAIKQEDLILALEAGAGARQSKPINASSTNEGILRGAANLEWKISKTSTFNQLLSVDAGEDSTVSRSVSSLTMNIVGNLAAKFSYSIKHSSDVPPGIEKKDTETIVTLVYKF